MHIHTDHTYENKLHEGKQTSKNKPVNSKYIYTDYKGTFTGAWSNDKLITPVAVPLSLPALTRAESSE